MKITKKHRPTAAMLLGALNRNDAELATDLAKRCVGSELADFGRQIGFYREYQEGVTSYRNRVIANLPEMTLARREARAREKATFMAVWEIATAYQEAVEHSDRAIRNGCPPSSSAFWWARNDVVQAEQIADALPKLVQKMQTLRGEEGYQAALEWVERARPAFFAALALLENPMVVAA